MNKFIGLRPRDYVPHPASNEPKIKIYVRPWGVAPIPHKPLKRLDLNF